MTYIIEVGPHLQELCWAIGAFPFAWFGAKLLMQAMGLDDRE